MDTILLRDLRVGLRQIRKTPGILLATIVMLSLGIGANTAMFSVMRAALYRAAPVGHPERLVVLRTSGNPGGQTGYGGTSLTYPVYDAMRQQTRVFRSLAGFVPLGLRGVAARVGDQPEVVQGDMVSGDFFSALEVPLALGHGFTLANEQQHASVAVIGYSYWTRRFSRSPGVLGSVINIKEVPFTIVGVAGRDFYGFEPNQVTDVWVPFQDRPELPPWGQPGQTMRGDPQWWYLLSIGRLQPGVTRQQAEAALQPAFVRAAYSTVAKPATNIARLSLTGVAGTQAMNDYDPSLAMEMMSLMAMVGLVLAIACANVALLVMACNQARQRDFRMRLALGASAWRMARQLLTESAWVVAASAALGWWLAVELTRAVAGWEQLDISLAPDGSALGFTLIIAAVVALAVSLAPMRMALQQRARLAAGAKVTGGGNRFGRVLAVAQIALSLALIANATLLVRSMRFLDGIHYGVRNHGLVVFGLTAPQTATTRAQRSAFFQSVVQQLRSTPGVAGVTLLGNRLGGGWSNNNSLKIDGVAPLGPHHSVPVRSNPVGAGYFTVMGQPLLSGRDFTDADMLTALRIGEMADAANAVHQTGNSMLPPVPTVVNQTLVDKYLHGRSPLGHTITFGQNGIIIGVAADAKYTSATEKPRPMAWAPAGGGGGTMQVEVRGTADAQTLLPVLRAAMQRIDPTLPMEQPATQTEQWQQSFSDQSLMGRLAMFFGFLAAVMVATGLYGTLAYKVGQRTPEIGVRMALGASRGRVVGMVLGESLTLSLIGLGLGLPLAFAGGRTISGLLFGVNPSDIGTLSIAAIGLLSVALLAALAPALRAADVDPLIALRAD